MREVSGGKTARLAPAGLRKVRGLTIYITHLSLSNFRNFERLDIDLEPGMALFHGRNAQGKSNLLEAVYLLAIAKSHRASSDRDMIRWQRREEDAHTRISATVQRNEEQLRVQIDFLATPESSAADRAFEAKDGDAWKPRSAREGRGRDGGAIQKRIRVNGLPRKASELVGEINAVLFGVDDIDLVGGAPPLRRRYLDILISQVDPHYLRSLQRYHRVLSQRNHLLKMIREGRSGAGEMDFWDDELVAEGAFLMAQRAKTVASLSDSADPIHRELTGNGERLAILYRPRVPIGEAVTDKEIASDIRREIEEQRSREIQQGFTIAGPHRDDLQMLIDGVDAGTCASRGQSRTAVLAMKLAEAHYLMGQRGHEPILLLDDVLSELDAVRRRHILDWVSRYQQCLITTADLESIEHRFLTRMTSFVVTQGRLERSNDALAGPG